MTTQFSFRIDEKLKKAFQKRLKQEGISASFFLRLVTRLFAEGKITVEVIGGKNDIRLIY